VESYQTEPEIGNPKKLPPNALTIRIQPDEGFNFEVLAKQPGLDLTIRPVRMNLRYESEFTGPSPDAYERLLLDVMAGDHTLFVSAAFVEKSWEFVGSILDQWREDAGHARLNKSVSGVIPRRRSHAHRGLRSPRCCDPIR
jgi:glucose-6-phosphate 1-dehydrogenase